MNTTRTNLSQSRVELSVLVTAEEMLSYSQQAATRLSEKSTIEGFRPGKAPYETIKARLGEMAILEEASRIAISKTIDKALKESVSEDWVGQPEITINKLAPDNDFEYKALITLLPLVQLGEYKNLGIKSEAIVVSDEEVEKVVTHLRDTRAKEIAVERPAEKGDKVILDISMSLDNVPLEGGQGKDVAAVLGSEYVVAGFDDHVIGAAKLDTRSFQLHYPNDYHQKQLAGKNVSFEVKVKDIFSRELPEINEEFAAGFGLKTPQELRTNIKESLEHEKKHEAAHKQEREILKTIVSKAKIDEISDNLIEGELDMMMRELEQNVTSSGGVLADYLTSINKTPGAMREELRPQALDRVQASLVLRAIINEEKIVVSAEDIDKEIEGLKKRYGQDPQILETLNSPAYRRQAEAVLLNRVVLEKLASWNT